MATRYRIDGSDLEVLLQIALLADGADHCRETVRAENLIARPGNVSHAHRLMRLELAYRQSVMRGLYDLERKLSDSGEFGGLIAWPIEHRVGNGVVDDGRS